MPSAAARCEVVLHAAAQAAGLITSGFDDGARVYWFVDETALHGQSTGVPPFSFTDPDANLTTDACPVEQPPIG